ncbi:11713_t:CDS:1, partial [Dentiscutata erythropus]
TNNEDTISEDELAKVVAHKTKKCRKRIRVQATTTSYKKSKSVVATQTPTSIINFSYKSHFLATLQDKSPHSDISQTDLKKSTSFISHLQRIIRSHNDSQQL